MSKQGYDDRDIGQEREDRERDARDFEQGYYGYPSERSFDAAYENEVYCPRCESHPCRCDRRRA